MESWPPVRLVYDHTRALPRNLRRVMAYRDAAYK